MSTVARARRASLRAVSVLMVVAFLLMLPAAATGTAGAAPAWAMALAVLANAVLHAAQLQLLRERLQSVLPSSWCDGASVALAVTAGLVAVAAGPFQQAAGITAAQSLLTMAVLATTAVIASAAVASALLCGLRDDRRVGWMLLGTLGVLTAQVLLALRAAGLLQVSDLVLVALMVVATSANVAVLLSPSVPTGGPSSGGWGQDLSAVVVAFAVAVGVLTVGALRTVPVPVAAVVLALAALVAVVVKAALLVREVLALQGVHRESLTDELTGVANRRALLRALDGAVAAEAAGGPRSALVMIDLDGFKAVNDTLGHQAGDELLRVVCGRLQAAVRPGDLLARLGGDEFAVLLGSTDAADVAADVAARLQRCFTEPMALGQGPVSVGASIGIAVGTPAAAGSPEAPGLDDLVRRADHAMYAAKAAGTGPVLDGVGVLAA